MANNSGPSFSTSRRGAYARLIKQGVENAMAAGWLFGRRFDKSKKVVQKADRGAVIWPDKPHPLRWVDLNPTPWSRAEAARINAEQAALFKAKVAAL